MDNLLTIIIPVFNCDNYLKFCLDSVINQKYKNFEIILIDDGSTDETPKICDEYSNNDRRIQVLHIPNGGVSNARNVGIEKASGDFITFLDADDWVDANGYSECLETMIRNQLDVVAFDSVYFYENINRFERKYMFGSKKYLSIYKQDLVLDDFFLKSAWVTNKIFKASAIKGFIFDENKKIGEDVYFLLNVLLSNKLKCANLSYPCYFRRVNDLSATGKGIDNNSLDFLLSSFDIYQKLHNVKKGYIGIYRMIISIDNIFRKIDINHYDERMLRECTNLSRKTTFFDRLSFMFSKRIRSVFKVRFFSTFISYKIRLKHLIRKTNG